MRCRPVPESVDHTNLAGLLTDFAKTNDFTDAELVASPIFRRFDNGLLHQTSLISIPQTELNKVLGDGIPATSFAAGRNETSGVSGNYNYQNEDGTPNGCPRRNGDVAVWEHSDIKNVAYYYVHALFEKIKKRDEDIRLRWETPPHLLRFAILIRVCMVICGCLSS